MLPRSGGVLQSVETAARNKVKLIPASNLILICTGLMQQSWCALAQAACVLPGEDALMHGMMLLAAPRSS